MIRRVRAIFLSDVHLGTRACQAERLLDFLRDYESDQLFLVGDIVDLWAMRRAGIYWSPAQNTFVQKVLRRARHHVDVVFVPGNHDEGAREHVGISFGNIQVEQEWAHTAADGRRYLVIHGDQFDGFMRYRTWLAPLGSRAYGLALHLNSLVSAIRRHVGVTSYWSLSGYAKRRVRSAVGYIAEFERVVIAYARERGFDGVICGHIHAAAVRTLPGMVYINCGDWVDSCTAVVEHLDGRMELVEWGVERAQADPQVPLPDQLVPA